jgi:hypothetical protein
VIGLGCLNANLSGMKTRLSEVVLKTGSRRSFRSSILSVVLMLPFTAVMAQSNGKGSAEGTLAVTATVVASTTMIIEADGQPRLIIVNATDFRDNVSRFVPMVNRTTKPDKSTNGSKKRTSSEMNALKAPA